MKKRTKKPKPPPELRTPADEGTPELAARCRGALIVLDGKGARRRNILQVPIDYYRFAVRMVEPTTGERVPTITAKQHLAGSTLHSHFHMAGLMPSSFPTTDLVAINRSSGEKNVSERQQHHRTMFRRALDRIKNPKGQIVAVNVCCYGYLLKDIALPYYPTAQLLMPLFKDALDDLIDFFGISDASIETSL